MNVHDQTADRSNRNSDPEMHRLWFTNAATGWDEALPIGNGRIGAMCFGRPVRDLIQINDDRGWSGGPHSEYQHGKVSADAAREALVAARAALAAGDHATAATELQRLQERYTQSFLPFVDLEVTVDGDMVEQYGRELDLRTGIHTQNYLLDGHHFQQISFASQPAQALIMAIESDAPKGVDVTIALTTPLREIARIPNSDGFALEVRFPSDVAPPHEPSEPAAQWDCATQSALEGAAIIAVSHDGTLVASDERGIAVTGARSIVVVVTTASTFRGSRLPLAESLEPLRREATDRARRQLARGFDRLRDEHIEDHAILYARTEISLPGTRKPIPTTMRLQEAIDDVEAGCDVDPFLIGLLFHYGRYLLIASSRAGTLPANLQGLWNDRLQPPWSSNSPPRTVPIFKNPVFSVSGPVKVFTPLSQTEPTPTLVKPPLPLTAPVSLICWGPPMRVADARLTGPVRVTPDGPLLVKLPTTDVGPPAP